MKRGRGRPSDEDIFLSLVPENGAVGNVTLLGQLQERGWSTEKYWNVRERLLDEGVLERGRGRGGSVRKVASENDEIPNVVRPTYRSDEAQLYEPLCKVLSTDWVREMRIEPDQIHFELTARQGKKATGGTWTRPDITAVSVRTFPHLPNKYLDVWTFEVKSAEGLDVTAIFETAAHASRATRSYALLAVSESLDGRAEETVDRCEREAARLRVGLITFTDASDFETWETKAEAPRIDTDPESLEEFIGHLSDEARKRLQRWR